MRITLSGRNTYTLSVQTGSLWEYAIEASDDLDSGTWTPLDTIFLPGDGGRHAVRVVVPQGAAMAFFRYSIQPRAGGVSGDTLPDWDRIYTFNASTVLNTTLDTDGDGIPDYLEGAFQTNQYDSFSFPWKVMRVDPFDNEAGHPRDRAVVVYLNRPLPASVVTVPANFVRELHHDVQDILDFANEAPGSVMILPGRKAVAFLPSPNLVAGPSHTYVNNYRIDFSTAVTGIPQLIPSHTEFATVNNFDTVGAWVTRVQPGETAFEVATDFGPVIDWSQPLLPSTVTSANVTVIEQASGNPVSVTVYFDYDTNRMTLSHATAFLSDAIYTVTLGTGFQNLMGKPLMNAFVWSFHTRPLRPVPVAGQGPFVTAVAPGDFSTNVDAMSTAQITLTFSEPMDDSTLTSSTVHLQQHGAGTDVTGAFAYDSATKTLTFTPDASLDFATRYELTLDATAIFSAATTPQPMQAQTQFVFTTGPDPASGGGGGGAGSGGDAGTPDPEQPQPLVLNLSYGDAEEQDAGASVSLSITLPDGSQREQQMPNVTNNYLTYPSPEIPAGSKVIVTPKFLKGTDTNPDEDESLEVLVNVSAAIGSESAAQTYGVTIEQDGNPVQYAQLTDGAAAKANPQQKAVVTQGDPTKCVQLSVKFPVRGEILRIGGNYFSLGGETTVQVQDQDGMPTGVGGKMEEKVTNATLYLESFVQLEGQSAASWHTVGNPVTVNVDWGSFTAPVDANGKFRDTPIGMSEGIIAAGYATCQQAYPLSPCRVMEKIERHEYRIQWQGKTFPAGGTALSGAWTQEIFGYYIDSKEVITSFTSTPLN